MFREDAQNRLINMSDEDKQQIALHKAEVKELQRQYDRDLKLQDFLSIKGTLLEFGMITNFSTSPKYCISSCFYTVNL